MIVSLVAPVKGSRIALFVMTLALLSGVAADALLHEYVSPEGLDAPLLIQGAGDTLESHEIDGKALGQRHRMASIDVQVLSGILDAPAGVITNVALSLFDDVLFLVSIEQASRNVLGAQSFSGRVYDVAYGYFMLSVDAEGRLLIQVEVLDEGIVYVVALDPGSHFYYISEYLLEEVRDVLPSPPRMPPVDKMTVSEQPVAPFEGDEVTVDVLVVYTSAAEQWANANRTGMDNVIAQALERGNVTLTDSLVDMQLRLVHAQRVEYVESGDAGTDLDNLTFHSGFTPDGFDPQEHMEDVHKWRDQYGADLVILLNKMDGPIAGIAWLLLEETGFPELGFSVTSVQYADYALIHEVGHNLGCHHSRDQMVSAAPPEGGLFEYSTGWRWRGMDNRGYVSIMTYPEGDTPLFLFSNPEVSFAGAPTGSYTGEFAPADNARSIREIKRVVAGYRETVIPEDEDDDDLYDDDGDPQSDTIWFVDVATGANENGGESWEAAFRTIQKALDEAEPGHEIWVAQGLYRGAGDAVITMERGVRLYGGFSGNESERDTRNPNLNRTVLDGEFERSAVVGASEAVLDGFTIVDGGMKNETVFGLILRNCRFEGNTVGLENINTEASVRGCRFASNVEGMINLGGNDIEIMGSVFQNNDAAALQNVSATVSIYASHFLGNLGGGMVNTDAVVSIGACRFDANQAAQGGALFNNNASSLTIDASSVFLRNRALNGSGGAIHGGNLNMRAVYLGENQASLDGGAIAEAAAGSEIVNCRFVRNSAGRRGGAMYIASNLRVINALVYANRAEEGAGFAVNSGVPRILHSTFAANFGYALYNATDTANPVVTNSIIWGNDDGIWDAQGNEPVVTNTNVQGGYEGQGNFDEDPLFRDLEAGDMYLLPGSPCIAAAPALGAVFYDIVGNDREGAQVTLGAWEYIGPAGGDGGEGGSEDPDEGEGEGDEDQDTADFNAETLVRDQEGLLPLHDWVPLFRFSMSYGEDNFAPRFLRRLHYRLRNDPDDDDRGLEYVVAKDLHVTDLLEFGIFMDNYSEDDEAGESRYGNLSTDDTLLFTWDNRASQMATGPQHDVNTLNYDLNFSGRGIQASPTIDDFKPDGNVYVIAVRTSATWRSQLSLGVDLLYAEMIDPTSGDIPRDEEGAPIDSYSPDFFDGEILEAEEFYCASFGVYDPSGPDFSISPDPLISSFGSVPTPNFWQQTPYLSIPLSEFSRPRWNKPQQLMSIVAAEFMDVRRLMALDDWTAVIGINLHSTRSWSTGDEEQAEIREISIVLTDVGGDPYGAPGNGGFNPNQALKPVVTGGVSGPTFGGHAVHNGIWLWSDENGNGYFDPPTPQSIGVDFNGDLPLAGYPLTQWEYVPLPPGGGDPWWRITLRTVAPRDPDYGFIEANPNNVFPSPDEDGKAASEFTYDFFVVARLDSGHKDCSLKPATNTGATFGAEFKAFIEPRRLDPVTGSQSGGILATSQIPAVDDFIFWQDDPRWLENEPWWPERTLNAKAAKPFKVGMEVYDLVHSYHPRNITYSDPFTCPNDVLGDLFRLVPLPLIDLELGVSWWSFGFSEVGVQEPSFLGVWLDPLGLDSSRFQNFHYPDIYRFGSVSFGIQGNILGVPYSMLTPGFATPHFPFETRPFFDSFLDLPPSGPRSPAYPTPPAPLATTCLDTWPAQLGVGEYPAYTDWAPEEAPARLLTQKIESNSKHTPMLGFNMTGSNDPVVNEEGNSITVAEINVAFWGPDFSPDILKPVDPDNNENQSLNSGVLLWENDADLAGATSMPMSFFNTQEIEYYGHTPLPMLHRVIPVTRLQWSGAPEYVDLSGNGLPDDLNGDGIVDERDKAWVLTLRPRNLWELPQHDVPGTPEGGLDMFLTVSTSDAIGRFQKFRSVVPATLPSRAEGRRRAGIQFYPPVNTSPSAYHKADGVDDPVVPFFGHDMLEANVPMRIVDMTTLWTDIDIGGAPAPVLGLNISTNREDGTRTSGAAGVGLEQGLHVPNAGWTANAYKGDFLVDKRYESYEILGNTADTLTLLSGTPRSGVWRIVQDPTFLEEVTVEFYQEGDQASFNPLTDLLPLDIDQRISGVAIYRDNDNHPDNRNGMFDPDIDIPLVLDAPPRFIGRAAEDIKVRFVFASPGTSNFPRPGAEQPRNRQWVHDSFGYRVSDPEHGPDFFIVVRASNDMQLGDNFRAGIVSWGPNTPTEPDPHIWANLAGEERHDYLRFREFPWGERGVGFISFFKEPPLSYFLHKTRASQRPDSSGFNWIRSHSAQKRRSGVITARNRPIGPRSLVIDSVSQRTLPVQTLPGQGFNVIIYGDNFGNNPSVALSGYHVSVNSAKNDAIHVSISTRADTTPQEPVTLVVRNPRTGDEASRSDLFSLSSEFDAYGPKIHGVNPMKGRKNDFPVIVEGENFFATSMLEVRFGETLMPVLDMSPDGTAVTVGFPVGGLPQTGLLDVFVETVGKNSGQDVKMNAFEYINPESRAKMRVLGCSPRQAAGRSVAGDLVTLGVAVLLLAIANRRRRVRV